MKKCIWVVVLMAALTVAGFGAPTCATDTTAYYQTQYSGLANACQVGPLLFYNFTFAGLTVAANQVEIAPYVGPSSHFGLRISGAPAWLAAVNTVIFTLGYTVAQVPGGPPIEFADLDLLGGSTTGGGLIWVSEPLPAIPTTLTASIPGVPDAEVAFAPRSSLNVSTSFTLSGAGGSFSLAGVAETFAIPEPLSFLLLGAGLVVLGVFKRRSR